MLLQGIYQSVKKPMCHFQMFKNRHDLSLGHAGCNFYQFQYLEQFRTVFGNILLTFLLGLLIAKICKVWLRSPNSVKAIPKWCVFSKNASMDWRVKCMLDNGHNHIR